ncbi:MAG: monovalent cation/H+ antiporter complex subunit F [Phycisphaera sp.]|nr:MAG: monovalent cation/H+ antiporter complex subunit F [Phycisphaera sp.]
MNAVLHALPLAQTIAPALNEGPDFIEGVVLIVLGMIALAMIGCLVRLLIGPTLPDRVVALDLMGMFAVAVIAIFAILIGKPVLLSVCLIMGLILFLGTAAFALYLERRARP